MKQTAYVIVTEKKTGLVEDVHCVYCDDSVFEERLRDRFFSACNMECSDFDKYSGEDLNAIFEDGFFETGKKIVQIFVA